MHFPKMLSLGYGNYDAPFIFFTIICFLVTTTASFCPCISGNDENTLLWGKFKCSPSLTVGNEFVYPRNGSKSNSSIPLFCKRNVTQCPNANMCSVTWSSWTPVQNCDFSCPTGMKLWKRQCEQELSKTDDTCPVEDISENCRNEICNFENDFRIHKITASLLDVIYPTTRSMFEERTETTENEINGDAANVRFHGGLNETNSRVKATTTDFSESSGDGTETYEPSTTTSPLFKTTTLSIPPQNAIEVRNQTENNTRSENRSSSISPKIIMTEPLVQQLPPEKIATIIIIVVLGIFGAAGWMCFFATLAYFIKIRTRKNRPGSSRSYTSGLYESIAPALPPRYPNNDNSIGTASTESNVYIVPATVPNNSRNNVGEGLATSSNRENGVIYFRTHSEFHKNGYMTPMHICPWKTTDPDYISFSPCLEMNGSESTLESEQSSTPSSEFKFFSKFELTNEPPSIPSNVSSNDNKNESESTSNPSCSKESTKEQKLTYKQEKMYKGYLKSKYGLNLKLNVTKTKDTNSLHVQHRPGNAKTS